VLYFAYGSNMSSRRLLARTPSATVVSVAKLNDHQLKFHKLSKDGSGKCDIAETNQMENYVLGIVYKIAVVDKSALDGYEGLGNGYEEKRVQVESLNGEFLQAFSYYATHIGEGLKPYSWYKEHVLRGAWEHHLPKEYIENIERIEHMADNDKTRAEKELAIYKEI